MLFLGYFNTITAYSIPILMGIESRFAEMSVFCANFEDIIIIRTVFRDRFRVALDCIIIGLY